MNKYHNNIFNYIHPLFVEMKMEMLFFIKIKLALHIQKPVSKKGNCLLRCNCWNEKDFSVMLKQICEAEGSWLIWTELYKSIRSSVFRLINWSIKKKVEQSCFIPERDFRNKNRGHDTLWAVSLSTYFAEFDRFHPEITFCSTYQLAQLHLNFPAARWMTRNTTVLLHNSCWRCHAYP